MRNYIHFQSITYGGALGPHKTNKQTKNLKAIKLQELSLSITRVKSNKTFFSSRL